jgi:hypothetical protein
MMYHDPCVAIVHIAGRNVNEGGIVDDSGRYDSSSMYISTHSSNTILMIYTHF